MYSQIELEIAAALRRRASADSTGRIRFRQFYPDRDIGPSFALHQGFVQPVDSGRVVLRHDWLSGAGDVIVDSAGRLLSYSGARSTYKVNVERTTALPDVEAFGDRLAADERAAGARQLSVRDTTRATIGAATFAVDYGRPLLRGRTLLGDVIPYDLVWRTGANAATQFTTSAPITLAGLAVPAGSYTLWTVPRRDRIELVVNTQTGIWGTAYSRAHDLGRATLQADSTRDPVERFTIEIVPGGASRGTLSLAWGAFRWTAPIVVR
jgi:hypothetical protein